MGGILDIREGLFWGPSGWIHDAVLSAVAAELQSAAPDLAELLLDARVEVRGYATGDITRLPEDGFRAVLAAARRAYERAAAVGPEAFGDPKFWPAYMEGFSELSAMLRWDPRSGEPATLTGRGTTRAGGEWVRPGWLFDMVLEQVAADVWLVAAPLSRALLAARTCAGHGVWETDSVDADGRGWLRVAAELFGGFYAKEHRHIASMEPDWPRTVFMAEAAAAYADFVGLLDGCALAG